MISVKKEKEKNKRKRKKKRNCRGPASVWPNAHSWTSRHCTKHVGGNTGCP